MTQHVLISKLKYFEILAFFNMFQLQWAIIRPKTEQSSGTFNDCALYGIPYCLHF